MSPLRSSQKGRVAFNPKPFPSNHKNRARASLLVFLS
uniref:Uncharacterized protein n=1 Tax=Arundo donax TaxID=35708 RepID=A0A0A9BYN9_ARUDO